MPADQTNLSSKIAKAVRPRWGEVIILCGKCLKRHDDGKALRRSLKAEVKGRRAATPKAGKTRIVKTACLGLCPRGSVVVASASSLAAGEVLLVHDADEVAGAVRRLLPVDVGGANR